MVTRRVQRRLFAGHFTAVVIALVVVCLLVCTVADGRSFVVARGSKAKELLLGGEDPRFVSDYAMGFHKDSRGRMFQDARHFVGTAGCAKHERMGKALSGLVYTAIGFESFAVLVHFMGVERHRALQGIVGVGLSLSTMLLTGVAAGLAAGFYAASGTCTYPASAGVPAQELSLKVSDRFRLSYALPFLCICFALSLANVGSLVTHGCLRQSAAETEPSPHSPGIMRMRRRSKTEPDGEGDGVTCGVEEG